MIEVTVTFRGGTAELAAMRLENIVGHDDGTADYSVQFAVDTGTGFAVYQRLIERFPRTRYNTLGLLRLALSALEEKEFLLDESPDAPGSTPGHARPSGYLARRLNRAV